MNLNFFKNRQQENVATKEKFSLRLPKWVKTVYIISACCIPLYVAFLISESFADLFNRYVSSLLRALLAGITSFIPFSLAELLLLLLPVWVVLITRLVTKKYGDSVKELLSASVCVCSALAIIFSCFTVGFAPAYRGSTLDKKLGIERTDVSADELYDTAVVLVEQIKKECVNVSYTRDGFSVMPYGYTQMSDRLVAAYGTACDQYAFVQRLNSRIKPVMLSDPMSYTHITGVYTFFTGEANLNISFPDYTLPFTAAHELSHQRGIAREDEANFMAFLVCKDSEDAYIRYSAYLNMYEYVMSALSRADSALYAKAYGKLPQCVKRELAAYSDFYDTYRDSEVSNVSEAVNDTFLKLHGTEGTKSYGMVVDLAVAYYKK